MSIKTPLGRVLGRGSARSGVGHWWTERVTAIALVPLSVWFMWALLQLGGFTHADVLAWVARPWSAVLLSLFVLTLAWHSQLGVQVVLEDYVHGAVVKFVSTLACTFAHVLAAAAAVFAILKIAFS